MFYPLEYRYRCLVRFGTGTQVCMYCQYVCIGCTHVRACPNTIEIENRDEKNRALIGAWFKHVLLRFSGCEKIHDLQPIAKIKRLSAENRKGNRKHEQQQFNVSYWSAQPSENITPGQPYTAYNSQHGNAAAQIPHSQQANHNNSPDVRGPLFPGVQAKANWR